MKPIYVFLSNFPYLVTLSFKERNKTWISYHSNQFALRNSDIVDSYLTVESESCREGSAARGCILATLLYPE